MGHTDGRTDGRTSVSLIASHFESGNASTDRPRADWYRQLSTQLSVSYPYLKRCVLLLRVTIEHKEQETPPRVAVSQKPRRLRGRKT